jgi:hypothetical protein
MPNIAVTDVFGKPAGVAFEIAVGEAPAEATERVRTVFKAKPAEIVRALAGRSGRPQTSPAPAAFRRRLPAPAGKVRSVGPSVKP